MAIINVSEYIKCMATKTLRKAWLPLNMYSIFAAVYAFVLVSIVVVVSAGLPLAKQICPVSSCRYVFFWSLSSLSLNLISSLTLIFRLYSESFEYSQYYAQSAFIQVLCFFHASNSNSFYIQLYIFGQLLSTLPSNFRIHLHELKSPSSIFSPIKHFTNIEAKRNQMWSMVYIHILLYLFRVLLARMRKRCDFVAEMRNQVPKIHRYAIVCVCLHKQQ